MINIYICEDDATHRENMEYCINRKVMAEDLPMEITKSSASSDEILQAVKQNRGLGIYFLDIELTDSTMNGLDLAVEIRNYDPDGYIIFVTTHSEMSYLTFQYKVGALDFIIKGHVKKMAAQIEECLEVIQERVSLKSEQRQDLFVLDDGETTFHIRFDDIYYFEMIGNHYVFLQGKHQQVNFSGTLKEIEKQLDTRFFRSHRSCLVNTKNIQSIDKQQRLIQFEENIFANVSKLKINELNKKLRF